MEIFFLQIGVVSVFVGREEQQGEHYVECRRKGPNFEAWFGRLYVIVSYLPEQYMRLTARMKVATAFMFGLLIDNPLAVISGQKVLSVLHLG